MNASPERGGSLRCQPFAPLPVDNLSRRASLSLEAVKPISSKHARTGLLLIIALATMSWVCGLPTPALAQPILAAGYIPYPVPVLPACGPVVSFNNSFPTYVNGQAVYSGYYVPEPPVPAYGAVVSFNNSFPTYVNGQAVYSGYYVPGY